jgi:hypothetical protein
MKDLGVASYCLGIEISQDLEAQTVRISQKKYFQGVLERFGMADCRAVSTPFPVGTKLTKEMSPKTAEERHLMIDKDYLGVLGCIMYGMLGTRGDLAFAVGVGSRFSSNPGIEHWNALMHVLRYIKGTLDLGITCHGPGRLSTPVLSSFLPEVLSHGLADYKVLPLNLRWRPSTSQPAILAENSCSLEISSVS